MPKTICIICCLLTLCITHLAAQDRFGLIVNNYNSENGLPQNSVKAVLFDKDGFLWIATEMGLVRFDGSRFKTFNRNNTPSLASDRIVKLGLQNDHTIYIRDERNQLYFFDGRQQMQKIGDGSDLLTHNTMAGFFDLQRLWSIAGNKKLENMMKPHFPGHVMFETSGDSTTGFLFFGDMRYFAYLSNYKMQWVDTLDNQAGTAVYQGKLYYLDSAGSIIQIDSLKRRSMMAVRVSPQAKGASISPSRITRLGQDMLNMYCLVGTAVWRLTKINDQMLEGEPVMDVTNVPDRYWYAYTEKMQLHMTASPTRGLFIGRKNPFRVVRPPAGISPVMYAQALLPGDAILTHAGVLPTGSFSLSIPMDALFHFFAFRDNRQHCWLVKQDTLYELDQQLDLVMKVSPGFPAQCMQQTPDGTIWISANDYRGHRSRFGKILGDSVIWKHINEQWNYNETFLPLNDHCFWLGNKNGLQELDVEKGTVKEFPLFANADVRSLYKDRKGVIWIGTYGNGFYAKYQDRFVKLPLDRNGYLGTAHTFLEDQKGFLWITTNKGLFQIKSDDLYAWLRDTTVSIYYHYYDKSDGLPTNEFNGGCNPAGIIFEDGGFSLPSMDGLVQFNPDSMRPLLPQNKILIDEVWVDSTRLTDLASYTLPPSFGRISISVSSPYFGNPYNQNIEYNLKGLDDKWYPLREGNTIIFNRLNNGKYQLQLRKKAGFGFNNYVYSRIDILVKPGFFDTWTFKTLLLALAGLLIYGLMKFRYRYLVRKKQLLEEEVKARTIEQQQLIGELQTTVQELEHSREELFYNNRFKEKLALLITHDLQSPLRFLSVMCDQLNEKATRNGNEEIRNSSNEIKNAGSEIHAFAEEIGLWATTQQENFRIHVTSFNLQSVTEELGKFFREMVQSQHNRLLFEIDPSVKLVTDRQLLKTILRNLIDNANKHTRNGTICITLATHNNKATISVADNGKGMHPKELQKIRLRMKQASRAAILDKGSRLGYQIIIDFVNRLEARLYLQSTPEIGTSVTIANIECQLQEVESQ